MSHLLQNEPQIFLKKLACLVVRYIPIGAMNLICGFAKNHLRRRIRTTISIGSSFKKEFRLAKQEFAHFCDLFYSSKVAPALTIALCSVIIAAYLTCNVGSFW